MEKSNQIFYLILGIFVLSLSINAYVELKNKNNQQYYWILALILFTSSCISFAIAPIISYFFLTVANTTSLASWICIAFLFRSWNFPIRKNENTQIYIYILILYAILFEYLRIQDNFLGRTYLVILTLGLTILYQSKQIYFLIKKNKSIHLKFIFLIIAIQLSITFARLVSAIDQDYSSVTNIYQEDGYNLTLRMVWYSMFLLLFIFIANYDHEQLLINQKKTTEKLNKKKKENKLIRNLLAEREELINSLIVANKTATTGTLSASIAHELNQPLSAIKLNTDFLKIQLNANNLDYHSIEETINNVNHDTQRAAIIINTLKSIFQQLTVKTTLTDINVFIESLIPIFSTTLKRNNIQLTLELNPVSKIMLNESEFQQVILNLVNNAIEALVDEKLPDKIIKIKTEQTNNYLLLSIIDNGTGVPNKLEKNLFTLMNTSKQSGTGLGLWLSKRIIERHNGHINYKHIIPNHVEFLITLPLT